jgi:hypothetical protein
VSQPDAAAVHGDRTLLLSWPPHYGEPLGARKVEQPGVYDGMPNDVYHRDPIPGGSLSSSGARMLLPPSCPALFHYWADEGQPPKREYDFGHAAHLKVLGEGEELVVVDAKDWRTNAAKAQRDEAYAAGKVPILAAENERAEEMAAAVFRHPTAGALFKPGTGKPEQSLFWVDEQTGIWRRARLDWLRNPGPGRLIVADYKTAASAEPDALARSLFNFGYYQQADWYQTAVKALGLDPRGDAAFVLVAQEKTPPYLITICEPDAEALNWGRRLNRKALDVYRQCKETDRWPGYSDEVVYLSLPGYAGYQLEAAAQRGDYDLEPAQ